MRRLREEPRVTPSASSGSDEREPETTHWRGLAILVAGAFFMENLDATIIATAAPKMAESLGVRSIDINVAIAVYVLMLAVFIPVSGWLSDRFGSRTVFVVAIGIFTLASGLCALSTSLLELTVLRACQGIGGAMMVPVGRLVVLRHAGKHDVINAIAYLTWPGLAAPVLAPVIGGSLTTYASWRWIFVINLPLGAIAVGVALWLVPNAREATQHALDYIGFALTGVGLATLVYSLELLSAETINWTRATVALTTGAVMLTFDIRHLRRTAHPLFDLDLLRIATYRVAVAGGTVFRIAIGAVPFLLPLLFQNEFGWTPLKSGLLVMVVFIGNIVIKPVTTPLLRSFGFQRVLVVAATAGAVTIALCALIGPTTPTALDCAVLFAGGVFRSIGFTAYNTIGFADIPLASLVSANSLIATVTQLATGLAVTIGAIMLRLGGPLSRLFGLSGSGADAFTAALILISLVALVPVVQSWRLHPDAGLRISSRPPPR
ncbi:MAG: MFS transporter [Pseudonocardiales bacterium]|nr:MAG: MFS transporter [Pseudonocardiales bacterium]